MREINMERYSRVSIDEINRLATEAPHKMVEESELYYKTQLSNVADAIIASPRKPRIILLCGPSASGKTTSAYNLKKELTKKGVHSKVLSMDDFFRGIKNYRLLDNGMPDMESVETLDMDTLNRCFGEIINDGVSEFPVFDFETQERSATKTNLIHLKVKMFLLWRESTH